MRGSVPGRASGALAPTVAGWTWHGVTVNATRAGTSSRIVVIGGGVIGLCSAIALRQRGAEVTLYDGRTDPPGASAWNCGWVAPSHCHPLPGPESLRRSLRWLLSRDAPLSIAPDPRLARWLLRFAWASRHGPHARGLGALAELLREAMPAWRRFEEAGLVIPWATESPMAVFLERRVMDATVRHLDEVAALGLVEPRILDREAALERVPTLSDRVVGAIEQLGERSLDPPALLEALRTRLVAAGGEVREERVTGIERAGGRVRAGHRVSAVRTASGSVECERLVLAAGAWSPGLARGLGLRLPVISGRGYVVDMPASASHPPRLLQLMEASMVAGPLPGRLRLCGTMELAGPGAGLDQARVRLLSVAPGRYLDGWDPSVPPLRVIATPRPMSPDGLPIIGPVPRTPRVIVATGHGMLGVTAGAATGELFAEIALGDATRVPAAFAPTRFRW
ncbi:FAD-dependent oxidoreductase [soil metagenome]